MTHSASHLLQELHLCDSCNPSDSGASSGPFPLLLGNFISGAATGVKVDSWRDLRRRTSCSSLSRLSCSSVVSRSCSIHASASSHSFRCSSWQALSAAASASFRASSRFSASLVSSSWWTRATICSSRALEEDMVVVWVLGFFEMRHVYTPKSCDPANSAQA